MVEHFPSADGLTPDKFYLHLESVSEEKYQALLRQAEAMRAEFPEREAELWVRHDAAEAELLFFYREKGFEVRRSNYTMQRDLSAPIPELRLPDGVEIRPWQVATEAEERQYMRAESQVFTSMPISLERLREVKQFPYWLAFAAFADGEVIGSLMAGQQEGDIGEGFTEDIFVLEAWRGQGIARCLTAAGLRYLRELGLQTACLSCSSANTAAVKAYEYMGYTVSNEELFLALPWPRLGREKESESDVHTK